MIILYHTISYALLYQAFIFLNFTYNNKISLIIRKDTQGNCPLKINLYKKNWIWISKAWSSKYY